MSGHTNAVASVENGDAVGVENAHGGGLEEGEVFAQAVASARRRTLQPIGPKSTLVRWPWWSARPDLATFQNLKVFVQFFECFFGIW